MSDGPLCLRPLLAIIVWIGGLSIVTTTLLPAIRRGELGTDWLAAFQAIERRFAWQARIAILLVGATGLYMVQEADLWDRFQLARILVDARDGRYLAIFAIGLFLVEPVILDRRLPGLARKRPAATFAWLARVHWPLLLLSLITVFGAARADEVIE
jgi:uncharacterized membrane protein